MLKLRVCALAMLAGVALFVSPASGQKVAKYGAEFLAGGVGARALGMGGAYVAVAQDVTAGYWNPSGLQGLDYPEAAYMHAERFAGAVSFDYGSFAIPVNGRSTVGISFFRSGVNDIKNTLDAWDPETDRPRPDAEARITTFSAADYAFFVSYARSLGDRMTVGVNGKMIRRTIGEFADAWGYSLDVGVQYRAGRVLLGATLQDAFPMLQSWSVDAASLQLLEDNFGEEIPQGGTEMVLPVLRLGSGLAIPVGDASTLVAGFDVDLAFDGQRSFVLNAGDVSFHPRAGAEFVYRGVVAFRAGVNRLYFVDGVDVTPTVGTGLRLNQLSIDYGFGDFGGVASELGRSHRISIQLKLEQPGLARRR